MSLLFIYSMTLCSLILYWT